jgi:hypothetical protein
MILIVACTAVGGALAAQSFSLAVTRTDGTVVTGEVVRLTASAAELRVAGQSLTVARTDTLALHSSVPRFGAAVTARLVGGDELRGELRGGDAAGESLVVESRSLGNVTIPTDRLQALVVHKVAGDAGASEFVLPAEGEHDEAIFLPAKRGFDTVFGVIHRFTSDGVLFAPSGGNGPRPYSLDKIAGIALRSGNGADGKRNCVLVTRGGDVIAVDVTQGDGTAVHLIDDRGRPFMLPWSEVATLLFAGPARVFLSDLQPDNVDESSALTAAGDVLYPWRADRNVRGGFLVVGGRTYARGLGVHSRSALTFTVPDGCTTFCVAVGIDDEVRTLPARGEVDVAVLLDGQVVAEQAAVRAGAPAHSFPALAVRAGSKLTLRVEFGAGLDLGDRVDWLHAVLLRQ